MENKETVDPYDLDQSSTCKKTWNCTQEIARKSIKSNYQLKHIRHKADKICEFEKKIT